MLEGQIKFIGGIALLWVRIVLWEIYQSKRVDIK